MPTQVDAARIEINEKLAAVAPQLEGLRDFERLNLIPESRDIIRHAIADYERRVQLLETARTSLAALVDDGHPDLPVRQIDQAAYADLLAQFTTIQAALAQFTAERAAALRTSAAAAEPKR